MHFEISLLIVWIAVWIVNTNFEFQVNIFGSNRDITKCQSFYTTTTTTTPRLYLGISPKTKNGKNAYKGKCRFRSGCADCAG